MAHADDAVAADDIGGKCECEKYKALEVERALENHRWVDVELW